MRAPAGRVAGDRRFVLSRTALTFSRGEGVDAAAALTFYASLALFPVALTLVSALALVTGSGRAIDALLDVVGLVARASTVEALRDPLLQLTTIPAPGLGLAIGLVLTVWAVSAYAECFGRTLNAFYGVPEGRPPWRSRAAMVLLSVPLVGGLFTCVGLVLATPQLVARVAERQGVSGPWLVVLQVGKWPVVALVLALMLAALYVRSPNVRRRLLGPIGWGAFIAVAGCGAATAGFALYLSTVGHYDAVYGWLSAPLVLLLWMYLIDLVLVYGAALDVELVRLRQLRSGIRAEAQVRAPLRDTARTRALTRRTHAAEAAGAAVRRRSAPSEDHRDAVGSDGYRGAMSREQPEGTPSLESVEQDFSVPEDADLRPVEDDGTVQQ